MNKIILILLALSVFGSCASIKKSFEEGNLKRKKYISCIETEKTKAKNEGASTRKALRLATESDCFKSPLITERPLFRSVSISQINSTATISTKVTVSPECSSCNAGSFVEEALLQGFSIGKSGVFFTTLTDENGNSLDSLMVDGDIIGFFNENRKRGIFTGGGFGLARYRTNSNSIVDRETTLIQGANNISYFGFVGRFNLGYIERFSENFQLKLGFAYQLYELSRRFKEDEDEVANSKVTINAYEAFLKFEYLY